MKNRNITESEKLHQSLNKLAEKFSNFFEETKSFSIAETKELEKKEDKSEAILDEDQKRFIDSGGLVKQKQQEFESVFTKLYFQSLKDNYYWQYCPFEVYKSHFQKRFEKQNADFPDLEFHDFINDEIEDITNHYENDYGNVSWKYIFDYYNGLFSNWFIMIDFFDFTTTTRLDQSKKRKIKFLEEKLNQINETNKTTVENSGNEVFPDYSEIENPERFVMLYELGIIDYLESKIPIELSERKLALLLSAFTGMNPDNIRSMINGTKNKNHNNKITKDSILEFERKLERLKIDPKFFKKDTKE